MNTQRVDFSWPEGAEQFPAAAFTQEGDFLVCGNREACELLAREKAGLFCTWYKGRPLIVGDFEKEPQ